MTEHWPIALLSWIHSHSLQHLIRLSRLGFRHSASESFLALILSITVVAVLVNACHGHGAGRVRQKLAGSIGRRWSKLNSVPAFQETAPNSRKPANTCSSR